MVKLQKTSFFLLNSLSLPPSLPRVFSGKRRLRWMKWA
jgi:hypothetical protein